MVVEVIHDSLHLDEDKHGLTNEDFRKLLLEKRKNQEREKRKRVEKDHVTKTNATSSQPDSKDKVPSSNIPAKVGGDGERRKKKKFYATLAKEEEERAKLLAAKYRDRAKERRLGDNPDYQKVDLISASSGYKAVAPDSKTFEVAAERRKQIIQESKFLGGDMEHTHLVKGLDYALLQKVKSELNSKTTYDDIDGPSEEIAEPKKPVEHIKQPVLSVPKKDALVAGSHPAFQHFHKKSTSSAISSETSKSTTTSDSKSNLNTTALLGCDDLIKTMGKTALGIKDPLAKSICRAVFCYNAQMMPKVNELFAAPRRMTYSYDLKGLEQPDEDSDTEASDDEGVKRLKNKGQTDIPTTVIRSKAECPVVDIQMSLTTNDIVVNKLTQILSYLRKGMRGSIAVKKVKKKDDLSGPSLGSHAGISKLGSGKIDDSIYGDIGDYVPEIKVKQTSLQKARLEQAQRGDTYKLYTSSNLKKAVPESQQKEKQTSELELENAVYKTNYFGDETEANNEETEQDIVKSTMKMVQDIGKKYKTDVRPTGVDEKDQRYQALLNKEKASKKDMMLLASASTNTYAECYPGYHDTAEAIYDSEDEVDFNKMDLGNKKGPVGRWDFDTQEEYSTYMSTKEALPKAAFQYGVKMNDGRKTRRTGPKDEKVKLDQQWQKISKIIQQRKATEGK